MDLCRGINEYKRGYQLGKRWSGDLLADSHNILNRKQKNYFCQLLKLHRVSHVRQMEIHTAEPLVSQPNSFEFEIVIANLKSINPQALIQLRQN
jgi:hypothetical protein